MTLTLCPVPALYTAAAPSGGDAGFVGTTTQHSLPQDEDCAPSCDSVSGNNER